MMKNVGGADKIIRIIIGLALLGWAFFGAPGPYNWIGYIGIVPLVTAVMGWCPLYTLLGIKTCPMKQG